MRTRFFRDAMIATGTAVLVTVFSLVVRPTTDQVSDYQAPRLPGTGNPNLSGIWQAVNTANWSLETHYARAGLSVVPGPTNDVPSAPILALGAIAGIPGGLGVVEGDEIPYKPEMLAKRNENAEHALTRDPEVKCFLPGVPRAMYMPYPFQIIQSTDRILMAFEYATAQRFIDLVSKTPAVDDSWMGHSIGHWDGDTLVVDVTGLNDQSWFDRAGNFHSDALHVVERYTPVSRDHLMYEATIEDPQVFTRPWKIRMPLYRRIEENAQLMDYKCVEFVEELMYGHLRKTQLVRRWEGPTMNIDITRKVPPLNELYNR